MRECAKIGIGGAFGSTKTGDRFHGGVVSQGTPRDWRGVFVHRERTLHLQDGAPFFCTLLSSWVQTESMIKFGLTLKCVEYALQCDIGNIIQIFVIIYYQDLLQTWPYFRKSPNGWWNSAIWDNLPRSIVHFWYICWSFDEFLGCFHTSPLERTGERASSPGPALPHQDVKVLAGIRAQLFCVKPQMRHLKISTHFPDLGGPYFFRHETSIDAFSENSRRLEQTNLKTEGI